MNSFSLLATILGACVLSSLAISSVSGASFRQRLQFITRNVNNDSTLSWTAGPSKFESWPVNAIKLLMGTKPEDPNSQTGFKSITHEHKKTEIPSQFDARDKWQNCPIIGQIRDQGACGSCWATCSASVMSDRLCIFSNGKENVHISTQHLTSCVSSGCNGGWPSKAFEYFQSSGIVSGGEFKSNEGCQAYEIASCAHHVISPKLKMCGDDAKTPTCRTTCYTNKNISFSGDKRYGISVYSVSSSESQIQLEIMKNGPVTATIRGFEDFLTYQSGVYSQKTGSYLGLHAVKLLGWGVDQGGVKYWLAANSWNTDWGEDGFFRIKRGVNECSIESSIWAGLPKVN